MAEVIGLAASIIAVVQLADRVASVCKYFIDSVHDYPKDLRLIYVKTISLKAVFEGLSVLDKNDPADWTNLHRLREDGGVFQQCEDAMTELDELFPLPSSLSVPRRNKKQKLQTALASLAWPFKASKAKTLLEEIMRHKTTIAWHCKGSFCASSS
jgi:hypothetical protein